ncbi:MULTISPECIES: thiol peroxidase [Lacticaseibacillus]|uniref:Thiol peroxidase n=1 Tax=Lacticaseibacillus casei DSM 20011 = JCM 1134 = ATCC 393 TaxID=1423732 RepID=A0AAD1AP67_LACCA|nr:peroxiredoxin [Lacticaseibacillus casei]MBI6596528.1 peroxiredoxin [Lacticaseibacillus casei]MBO1480219.1 peroxiredoxin [Lacticaseibacillus casei]MBO2415548.1 peroxiredoxin [Lacticaseibacillus casei]MCK2079857.1 peroxiredoxin [Lacticaseibacillus casei]MDZ5495360.1 peroxiredoxin [Lacticaseibacillus casei]
MEITRHGTVITTNGNPTALGEKLPAFTVTDAKGQPVKTSDLSHRLTLISVVPDINTRVCSISTKHFNQDMDEFDNVDFYTISTNTPQEQQSWCAAENVTKMQLLSDQNANFGKAMGLFVADNHTDARSVWIVDGTGTVKYRELITEQTHEPDYTSALAYLEAHQA